MLSILPVHFYDVNVCVEIHQALAEEKLMRKVAMVGRDEKGGQVGGDEKGGQVGGAGGRG